jgi:hypothetical protein
MSQSEACEREKRLNADLATLIRWMGDKTFWANLPKVRLARKGVTVQYLTGTFANPERVETNYTATMLQFTRRAGMLGVLDKL